MKLILEDGDIQVGSFRPSGQVLSVCKGCGAKIGPQDTHHSLAQCLSEIRQRLEALEARGATAIKKEG